MITFSTEFPVTEARTVDDVLELGKTWLLGSPHTKLSRDELDVSVPPGEHYQKAAGAERVEIAHATTVEYALGGFRYSRIEKDAIEWVTTIVASKSATQLLMSLQISCEALNTITRLPKPNKPYIIKQALEHLGGGMDGEIPVADKPFRLSEDEVRVAATLINGQAGNRLPLVYVSARYDGAHEVDADELARWLAGLAHVVVEPSRSFSVRLKETVNSRNVYGGSVGVYWPASYARKAYFRTGRASQATHLQIEIAHDIRTALANRRQTSRCTWVHLMEVLSALRLEKIRQSGSTQLDELVEALDAEIKAKDQRLTEAELEIARLNAEIGRQVSPSLVQGGLLRVGVEQDLYPGEIQDVAIAAIEQAAGQALDGSRRQHVLSDLLAHNAKGNHGPKIDEEVKAIFRTYMEMDAKTRTRLSKLGFDLTEEGKHFKAVYQGDGRYTFAIAKSSSDHRGGKNLASDILKTIL